MHDLKLFDHCFLAGGAIRSFLDRDDPIADYDIFFTRTDKIDVVRDILVEADAVLKFACPKGQLFTYHLDLKSEHWWENLFGKPKTIIIQLICKAVYTDVASCVNTFDINAGRFGYDGISLYTDRFAIKDVRTKVLTLFSVSYPAATLGRIYKYAQKGYKHYQARIDFINLTIVADRDFNPDDLTLYSID